MRLRFNQPKLVKYIPKTPIRTAFDWTVYLNRADGLRLLWRKQIRVDTQVSSKDGLFSELAHWQVLVAFSPELIDASELIEANKQDTNNRLVLPSDVSGHLAQLLVRCAYGEPIELDKTSLQELFSASEHYSIQHCITICLSFARRQLDVNNCVQLLLLGIKYKHQKLNRSAYAMLRSNFKLVLHTNDDFHLLPFEHFRRLLVDDHLAISEDEELSYVSIVSWLSGRQLDGTEIKRLYMDLCSSAGGPANQLSITQPQLARGGILAASSASIRRIIQPTSSNQRQQQQLQQQQQQVDFLNHYSPPTPFECCTSNKKGQFISNSKPLLVSCHKSLSIESELTREEQIYELFKCLRFMRFRSLNAFNVMLAHHEAQSSEKLSSLIRHMRARYIIRKRLDTRLLGEQLPRECLDMLQISESKQPMRFVVSSLRRLRRLHSSHRQPPAMVVDEQEDSARKQTTEQKKQDNNKVLQMQQVRLTKQLLLEQLKADELKRANEPRVPSSVALLIGGWQDGKVCRSLLAYDYICDKWFKLRPRLPEARAFHATCCVPNSGFVYIMGGTNGKLILNSVLRFDPFHGLRLKTKLVKNDEYNCDTTTLATWLQMLKRSHQRLGSSGGKSDEQQVEFKFHSVGRMNERRCHLSAVYSPSDRRLYALGGHNGLQRLRSGEWFDTRCNQWHPIADMTIARSDASACSHGGKIFIAGGQIGDQFIQSSVEFYKPSDNTWTFVASMIVPRMAFKLVSFKSHLLAIGGTNGLLGDEVGSVTRSVERYDHNSGSWSLAAPMKQKRGAFGLVQIGGQLIVVGGHNGRRRLKTCEALRIGHLERPRAAAIMPPGPPTAANHETAAAVVDNQQQQQQQQPRRFGYREVSPIRSVMRWVAKGKLPIKRSGFSIVTVYNLRNARQFTYHGSKVPKADDQLGVVAGQRPALIKPKSKWSRLKLMKRRKLVRHLKIALAISIVYVIIM